MAAKRLIPCDCKGSDVRESLAIPTWRYGDEPSMPFATRYAKYFQNSIREEALVRNARAGIIYAQGGRGTIREIFEDLEENYYVGDPKCFTPMIFFDVDNYWQHTCPDPARRAIKLDEVVHDIVRVAHHEPPTTKLYSEKVLFSTDHEQILSLLQAQTGHAHRALARMLA